MIHTNAPRSITDPLIEPSALTYGAAATQRDAQRYRWLRNRFNNNWSGPYFEPLEGRGCFELKQGDQLDAAIDAAMAPNASS
jgi:hypothetical protein